MLFFAAHSFCLCGHYTIVIYCVALWHLHWFWLLGVIGGGAAVVRSWLPVQHGLKGIQFWNCTMPKSVHTQKRERERERESLSHSFILWCNRKEFHAMCYCNKTTLLDFIWRCVVLYCIVCCYIFCSVRQIFIYLNDRKMCVHCILTPLSGWTKGLS